MSKNTTMVKETDNEVKVTWRIPADLYKQLRYMAIDENTTVTDLAVRALKDLVRKKK